MSNVLIFNSINFQVAAKTYCTRESSRP